MSKENAFWAMTACALANLGLYSFILYKHQVIDKQYKYIATKYHECVVDHDMAYMISPDMMRYIKSYRKGKTFTEYDYE